MSHVPAFYNDIAQAEPQPKYTVRGGLCVAPSCLLAGSEEHHALPKWYTRGWKERDWAIIHGELLRIKFPACATHHERLTQNKARIYRDAETWSWHEKQDGVWHHVADIPLPSLTEGEAQSPAPSASKRREHTAGAPDSPSVSDEADVTGRDGENRHLSNRQGAASPERRDADLSPVTTADEHECHATCTCGREFKRAPKRPYVKKTDVPTGFVRVQGPKDAVDRMNERIDELALRAGLEKPTPFVRFKALDMALTVLDSVDAEVIRQMIDKELGWAA